MLLRENKNFWHGWNQTTEDRRQRAERARCQRSDVRCQMSDKNQGPEDPSSLKSNYAGAGRRDKLHGLGRWDCANFLIIMGYVLVQQGSAPDIRRRAFRIKIGIGSHQRPGNDQRFGCQFEARLGLYATLFFSAFLIASIQRTEPGVVIAGELSRLI